MTNIYRRIALSDPDIAPHLAWRRRRLCREGVLHVPALAFGQTDLDGLIRVEQPHPGAWRQTRLPVPQAHTTVLRDAIIHPPFGTVTVGDCVISETLHLFKLETAGYEAIGPDHIRIPPRPRGGSFRAALHMLGSTSNNYFHWLMEFATRLQIRPLARATFDGVIFVPPLYLPFQRDTIEAFGLTLNPVMMADADATAHVAALTMMPNLAWFGFAPHPALADFYRRLRQRLRPRPRPSRPRRLFIARHRTPNRRLVNEAELIDLVSRHGFAAVDLATRSLAEQAQAFADATHIIGPHGAGLANVVFCRPGTVLLELHVPDYVNWCIRRAGGLSGIRYGCVLGELVTAPVDGNVHTLTWRIDPGLVENALRQMVA